MRVYLILLLNFFLAGNAISQVNNRVNGTVKDSLNKPITGASIIVVSDADTLHAVSDFRGKFGLSGITTQSITLIVKSMGYLPNQQDLQFITGKRVINVPVFLAKDKHTLKEVVITTQVIPIRVMKDTIEYNAGAYLVRDNDRVDELLKQLPGINFDREGRVVAMGKVMTKLRVNGEDFFTNSVKDFIGQLPADIIAKVQVITDYGDEANFTGNKTGESQKMLNLVTKPGRGKGKFGNTSLNTGTNHRYGLQTNGNLWREKKQIGLKGNINSTNNASGVNRTISTGLNYRDKLSETLTTSLSYNFDNNRNENHQLDYIESINTLGTLNTINDNSRTTGSNKHNLNWNVQSVGKQTYLQSNITGSFLNSNSTYQSFSRQTGVIKQDMFNRSATGLYAPEFSGNLAFSRRMKKNGRNLSVGLTVKNGINNTNEGIDTRIGYYSTTTGLPVKDSTLNRLVDTHNRSRNINGTVRFSEPLSNRGDSSVSKNLDIYYAFDMEENANDLLTSVNNLVGVGRIVDSLSTRYTSRFTSHLLGTSFRYGSDDLSYSLGVTGQPNILKVLNKQPRSVISHTGFNISPVANVSYNLSEKTSLTFLYNGSSVAPNFNQLQPVPNTRNLQNIIIGNPNLKSTFNQAANLSFQNSNLETGRALMLGLSGNIIQNQVVSNVILRRDTLNSLRQETTFLNASGGYNFDGLYSWSKPYIQNILNLEVRGSVGFGNTIAFSDNVLNENKGFNFSQAVMIRMNKKALSITADANYNYYSNRYSLAYGNLRNIEVYEFNLSMKAQLVKRLMLGFDALKRINIGYALAAENPFIVNMSLEKSFLKREQGTIKLQAYDILNQGNYLIRNVADNAIIDSRSNRITRYLQLSLNINLQQFGG
jgi:hypothetical protein